MPTFESEHFSEFEVRDLFILERLLRYAQAKKVKISIGEGDEMEEVSPNDLEIIQTQIEFLIDDTQEAIKEYEEKHRNA